VCPDAKVGVNVPVLKPRLISLRGTYPGYVTVYVFGCSHPGVTTGGDVFALQFKFYCS